MYSQADSPHWLIVALNGDNTVLLLILAKMKFKEMLTRRLRTQNVLHMHFISLRVCRCSLLHFDFM